MTNPNEVKEITVKEFKKLKSSGVLYQLIDVREEAEYVLENLGGVSIPLAKILQNAEKIATDRSVIIHCGSGRRSANAILELQQRFGFTNLLNLKGGIQAWKEETDSNIAV